MRLRDAILMYLVCLCHGKVCPPLPAYTLLPSTPTSLPRCQRQAFASMKRWRALQRRVCPSVPLSVRAPAALPHSNQVVKCSHNLTRAGSAGEYGSTMERKRQMMSRINPPRQTRPDPQLWAPPFQNLNLRPPYWNHPRRRGDRHTSLNAQQRAGEVSITISISTSITTVPPHSRAAAAKPRSPSGRPSATSAPGDPCATPPSSAARTVVIMQPLGTSASHMLPTAKFPTRRSRTARRAEVWGSAAGHPNPHTDTTTAGSTTGRTVPRQREHLNPSIPVAVTLTAARSLGCPHCRTATTTGLLSVSRGTIKGPVWPTAAVMSAVPPRPHAPWSRCPAGHPAAPGGPVLLLLHPISTYAPSSIHSLGR